MKPALSIIIGKIKKERGDKSAPWKSEGESKDESDSEENPDVGLESAADSLISAIKKDDTSGVVEALRNFISMVGED